MDDLMTAPETGEVLRTPEATLAYWRHIGYGPRFMKVGRRVLYRRADVEAWLETLASA
jgi:predicted DNA-binding transcriptional regulator AlpA